MNDVDFENSEEANIGDIQNSSINILKYVFYIIIFLIIFISAISFFLYYYFSLKAEDDINQISDENITIQLNLTSEEYEVLSKKLSIVDDFLHKESYSKYFTPLFTKENDQSNKESKELLPLNKISFAVSSSPRTAYLCKLYFDMWSTSFGSNIIRKTEVQPYKEVYWNYFDAYPPEGKTPYFSNLGEYRNFKSYKISLINQSSHHRKWFYMIRDNFQSVPSDVEWFVIADDDTLPFIDRIDEYLSEFKDPLKNPYFIHSPGERISGTHLGNGGSGFMISRKLAEIIIPYLDDCMQHIRRRFYNGDIRLDHCIRVWGNITPSYDYGLYHMDPKSFKGDLTGFVEGYMDRNRFKGIHHLEKSYYYLFPIEFVQMMETNGLYNVHSKKATKNSELNIDYDSFSNLNHFSQVAHFVNVSTISGDLFLKRYIIMFNDDDHYLYGILNFGYSFVLFDSTHKRKGSSVKKQIYDYLMGVEKTFTSTYDVYDNLTRLLVPKNEKLKRFYYKKTVKDTRGKNSYYQEYSSVSSPETVVKIHVDDNQKVTLTSFNYSNM